MKKVLREGDFVTAEFIKNQKEGKRPIIIVDGLIGFVDRNYHGEFLQVRAIWQFEVTKVNASHIVVMPVQKIKTPQQNEREIDARMKDLQKKFTPKKGKTVKS